MNAQIDLNSVTIRAMEVLLCEIEFNYFDRYGNAALVTLAV